MVIFLSYWAFTTESADNDTYISKSADGGTTFSMELQIMTMQPH
jgi:hypothetical protein